jgi:cardiolipin synthase A/B
MFPEWSITVLGPLFYIAAAIIAFEAIRRARTPQGAVGWAVFLFAWPVLAVPLYLLFGYARVRTYAEARREAEVALPDGATAALSPDAAKADRLALLRSVALHPVSRGNGMSLLSNAAGAFEEMSAAIDRAEHYVIVQFYTIRSDKIGWRLAETLIRAADRGVRVRVLYDAVGSFFLSRRWRRRLAAAGIELRVQRGPARPLGRFGLNFRNHRKILVVDGTLAFTGGMNVGDEYLGPWRDTQIALRGPLVAQLQAQFLQDWYWVSGQRLDDELSWSPGEDPSDMTGLVLGASPTDPHDNGALYFMALAETAKRRLWLATPYFAPDQSVLAALKLAALRGVEVRILTPEVPDRWTPWIAGFAFFDEVTGAGCEIWRYQGEFMHQKAALVDDDIVSIGTMNLDIRSCLLNFETTAVICDTRAAAEVEAMLEADFARSLRLDRTLDQQPLWLRVAAPVARLLAPLL